MYLVRHAMPYFIAEGDKVAKNSESMWSIIKDIAADPENRHIVFLLDALDECDSSQRVDLISKLKEIDEKNHESGTESVTTLQFLVTSRPYWDIEREFSSLIEDVQDIELRGEEESASLQEEISIVLKARVSKLRFPGLAKQKFLQRLLSIPNRTYLWLRLILEPLEKESRISERKVSELIDNIPETVYEAYDKILSKCTNPEETKRLFQIMLAAFWPLTLKEMQTALYVQGDMSSVKDLELQDDKEFKTTVRDLGGLLVSVLDGKVFFIHRTAQEYLSAVKRPAEVVEKHSWRHSLEKCQAHHTLAVACIAYLKLKDLKVRLPHRASEQHDDDNWRQLRRETFVQVGSYFLDYASCNWMYHAHQAAPDKVCELTVHARQLLHDGDCCNGAWKRAMFKSEAFIDSSEIELAAWYGYYGLAVMLTREKIGSQLDLDRALWNAVREGYVTIVECLLDAGANVNAVGKMRTFGYTTCALQEAITSPYEYSTEMLRLLLDRGACVSSSGYESETCSGETISKKNQSLALLFEKYIGGEFDYKDSGDCTAVAFSKMELIKVLLKKGH